MITDEQLQHKIMVGSHSGLGATPQARCTGGHFGMTHTREIIMREYYWRGGTKDVELIFRDVTGVSAEKVSVNRKLMLN